MGSKHRALKTQFNHVLSLVAKLSEQQNGERMQGIVAESMELLNVGEEGIAFEIMVQNLYEFEYVISQELLGEIDTLGRMMSFSSVTWEYLAELLPPLGD